MLIRYKTGPSGKPVKQALIYTQQEHGIRSAQIDFDAVKITRRLQRAGFEAYIVGGAVRDLLLGKNPKDFDVATSAEPNQIRKLFRNSRIIGKRFRLVHIFFPDNKIIEVSTFRAREAEGFKNLYGDIEEDALRRDFTLNGLYFDTQSEQIVDFNGGVRDIRAKRILPIIPLRRIFVEDPVRTVRAVKYAVSTGSKIPFLLGRKIRASAKLLEGIASSRLSEEVFKILQGGRSRETVRSLIDYKLFPYLLPNFAQILQGSKLNTERLLYFLGELDDHVENDGESRRSRFLAFLCADYFYRLSPWKDQRKNVFTPAFQGLKDLIRPVSPANKDVEQAAIFLIRQRDRYLRTGVLMNTLEKDSDDQDRRDDQKEDGGPRPRRRRRRRPRKSPGAEA